MSDSSLSPKIRILAVDDDHVVCLMLTLMLSDERCRVETTQSVADALAAIEQKPFDVYVMDYKLSDGSGLEVAERIRSRGSEAPIILISGYDPKEVALRAEKFHISGYLRKPFSRPMIRDAVKKAISEMPDLQPQQNLEEVSVSVPVSNGAKIRNAFVPEGRVPYGEDLAPDPNVFIPPKESDEIP